MAASSMRHDSELLTQEAKERLQALLRDDDGEDGSSDAVGREATRYDTMQPCSLES
jgi:hypothetical protein